jgi:hypothetical protein
LKKSIKALFVRSLILINQFSLAQSLRHIEAMDEAQRSHRRAIISFWMLGLLNNSSFDIMIAAAETISSGGVSVVHLCLN